MTTQSFRARLLAVALGSLLCAPAAFSQPATGPWAKVPPLTTACYYGTDTFDAKLEAAVAAVQADRDRQLAINKQVEDEYKSIEPMEMASRMQQWMMSNPQEAMQYMQGMQAVGEDYNTGMPAMMATEQGYDNEYEELGQRYYASLDKAYAPGYAKHVALKKKIGTPLEYKTVGDPSTPDWAMAEENVIMRELDQAYAAHCPQWWVAAGPVQAWLKTYRTWLTNEWIPFYDRLSSQNAQTYAIMGTPSASWKTVSAQDAVIKYLAAVVGLYGMRREKPRCDATDCADLGAR
jgi:hypothetical protein